MIASAIKSAAQAALLRLLPPLVRLAIRADIGFSDFAGLLRVTYARVGKQLAQPRDPSGEPNYSGIAAITDLNRNEVRPLLASADAELHTRSGAGNRCVRTIDGWLTDPKFTTQAGTPKLLPMRSADEPSFTDLVRAYSGDARAQTILDELLHAGSVEILPDTRIRLMSRTFSNVGWDPTAIQDASEQGREHLQTLLHNLENPQSRQGSWRVVNPALVPADRGSVDKEVERRAASFIEAISDSLKHPSRRVSPGETTKRAIRYSVTVIVNHEEIDVEPVPIAPTATRSRRKTRSPRTR